MCLAIPGKISALHDSAGVPHGQESSSAGITREACLSYIPERASATTCSSTSVSRSAKWTRRKRSEPISTSAEMDQLAELKDGEPESPAMKYLDEYRDQPYRERSSTRSTGPSRALGSDGGLRRPDPLHRQVRARRPASARSRTRARPGLSGLRDLARDDRPGARHRAPARRDLLLLRRHAARARLRRRSLPAQGRRAATSASSIRRSTA